MVTNSQILYTRYINLQDKICTINIYIYISRSQINVLFLRCVVELVFVHQVLTCSTVQDLVPPRSFSPSLSFWAMRLEGAVVAAKPDALVQSEHAYFHSTFVDFLKQNFSTRMQFLGSNYVPGLRSP